MEEPPPTEDFCSINDSVHERVKRAHEIFEQYGSELRAFACYSLKDKSLVDDIMQDFFLSLVSCPIPEGIEDIKRYIFKAITNDVIDRVRRIRSYQESVRRYARDSDKTMKQKSRHEDIVTKRDEIAHILEKIQKHLPPCEAKAVINYYTFKFDIQAAAKKMQVDKRTFSRYVSVGLKKFRQLL